jgi:hypothetical protein
MKVGRELEREGKRKEGKIVENVGKGIRERER